MKIKSIFVLFLFLTIGFIVLFVNVQRHPYISTNFPFAIQEEYAHRLEDKLVNLLEPATGIGNVRASVQADIQHKNITKITYNPLTSVETKINESGPVVTKQSVSVLINDQNQDKLSTYQNLIATAVGFNPERGDQLSIKTLPFATIPLWTLGLPPIVLTRIAVILTLIILMGIIWLVREWQKASLHTIPVQIPNEESRAFLHQEAEKEIKSFIQKLESSALDSLAVWSDEDIQELLHYVRKSDLVKALQMTSFAVQNAFERNIPPALWQELLMLAKENKYSFTESRQAQEEIMRLACLIKEKV